MQKTKILVALLLIFFGIIGRLLIVEFVKIPNLEIITSFSLIGGAMLGGVFTFLVPLGIIAITDMYLGNTFILIFTWSAFAVIGILGFLLRKRKSFNPRFVFEMTGMGIIASLFFYLYTNFGWWLLSGMYLRTWQGLVHCYIMGLPFLRINLLGNLFLVPVFTSLSLLAWKYYPVLKAEFLSIFKLRYKYDSFR